MLSCLPRLDSTESGSRIFLAETQALSPSTGDSSPFPGLLLNLTLLLYMCANYTLTVLLFPLWGGHLLAGDRQKDRRVCGQRLPLSAVVSQSQELRHLRPSAHCGGQSQALDPLDPLTTAEASNMARDGRVLKWRNLAQTPVLPTLGRPLRPEELFSPGMAVRMAVLNVIRCEQACP